MDTGIVVLVVAVALATLVVALLVRGGHPGGMSEERGRHPDDDELDTTSERFYDRVDRPAGPDAEDPVHPDRERRVGGTEGS